MKDPTSEKAFLGAQRSIDQKYRVMDPDPKRYTPEGSEKAALREWEKLGYSREEYFRPLR